MVKISDHGEDHTPWATWEYHWGILKHFLKICKIFRDRNLNRKQEIFRWRLFNLSTAHEGWNANKHHIPETKVWANLFNVQMVRVICCEQGIWRVWALMQLLIHRASALALLEDEQKFKLGGCWWSLFPILTVNFSGINWASHYVPYIFCLFLTSATSFGWVVVAGTSVPKIMKNGQNPRPTVLT